MIDVMILTENQFLRQSYVKKYLRDISLSMREISLKKTKNYCTGDCSNYILVFAASTIKEMLALLMCCCILQF